MSQDFGLAREYVLRGADGKMEMRRPRENTLFRWDDQFNINRQIKLAEEQLNTAPPTLTLAVSRADRTICGRRTEYIAHQKHERRLAGRWSMWWLRCVDNCRGNIWGNSFWVLILTYELNLQGQIWNQIIKDAHKRRRASQSLSSRTAQNNCTFGELQLHIFNSIMMTWKQRNIDYYKRPNYQLIYDVLIVSFISSIPKLQLWTLGSYAQLQHVSLVLKTLKSMSFL